MNVIEHPETFKRGYRVLLKTHRSKDGGSNRGDRHSKKFITTSVCEYEEKFKELLSSTTKGERIYSTVDERIFEKAIKLFKQRQLDADYFDEESRNNFYLDIYNRWVSCLCNKSARGSSLFLIDGDYDDGDEEDMFFDAIRKNETNIIHDYKTKNGFHIITEAFNYTNLYFKHKIYINAMMLCAYD